MCKRAMRIALHAAMSDVLRRADSSGCAVRQLAKAEPIPSAATASPSPSRCHRVGISVRAHAHRTFACCKGGASNAGRVACKSHKAASASVPMATATRRALRSEAHPKHSLLPWAALPHRQAIVACLAPPRALHGCGAGARSDYWDYARAGTADPAFAHLGLLVCGLPLGKLIPSAAGNHPPTHPPTQLFFRIQ